MSEPRIPLVAGNWKMYKGPAEARAFAEELLRQTTNDEGEMTKAGNPELAVFPPFTALPAVAEILRGTSISYGGQNCHWESSGAFTGETAPGFLAELGCQYVLVGHSERRSLFGETDETCRKKLAAAIAAGIEPVLCCGETLAEREADRTFDVIERQLRAALADPPPPGRFTVAYEPVWAIGTGRTATPVQAGEVHHFIREWLGRNISAEIGERTRLLYGGSVKPDNFGELMKQPDIDGALVGGASLQVTSFCSIAGAARSYLTGLI
ncbi:MAG: triose-phosphate isomerase [candidate division WOR-3 bacterium]|nr:triose-phosphate isomerase [candidate division WOR-3 bacterium]